MWESKLEELSDIKAVGYDSSGVRGNGISNPVAQLAERRDKIYRIIAGKKDELSLQEAAITEYIMSIDDSLIRQIMYKRHIELKSWIRIAHEIGNNTPDGVRMLHSRFLKKK